MSTRIREETKQESTRAFLRSSPPASARGTRRSLGYLKQIRAATRLPLLVGSGCTQDNVALILSVVDAVIVANSLKIGGVWWNPVEEQKVKTFMRAARVG